MKKKITPLSRICGIILGIVMTVVLASVSIHSMLVSTSFYLGQNDRYNLTEEMKLLSVDDYLDLIQQVKAAFSFEVTDPDALITVQGDVESFEDTFIKQDSAVLTSESLQVSGQVELSEKFISTVKRLENRKGNKTDEQVNKALFNNVMGLKIISEAENLKIKDVRFFDNEGNKLQSTLYSIIKYSDGSVKREEAKEDFITLNADEKAEAEVDAFIFSEEANIDASKISYSLVLEGAKDMEAEITFSYKDSLTKEQITKIIGKKVPMFTANEQEEFSRVQGVLRAGIGVNAVLFALAVVLVAVAIKKQGKIVLFGTGFYAAITMVILAAAMNILALTADFSHVISFGFEESTFLASVFTDNLVRDFASGLARFYDFMLIIPAGIIYILMRIAVPKKGDPNDDYLYQ
ncbi:MAG: hypothetical protein IKB86_05515 [Clostridia bacterium]|nr:hypothetical protein [Clostridia bacterium]